MNELKNKNPFNIPENYFAELEQNILAKTTAKAKVRRLDWKPFMAAASFILIIVAFFFTITQSNEQALIAKKEQMAYKKLYDLYLVEDNPNTSENDSVVAFYSDDLIIVME